MEGRHRPSSARVGVDTGGTFTDFVVWRDGLLSNRKVLSTPDDPSRAIFEGLGDILKDPEAVFIIHGTTVATNALLERKGGRIALVTTAGFEDVLAIGRQTRRALYALQPETRFELVPAERRFGLRERTLASGRVERPVSRAEVAPPRGQDPGVGRRGRGRLPASFLRQPEERGERGRRARKGRAARVRLEPSPARVPGIRADVDDGRRTPTSCRSWTATSASSTAASARPSSGSCSRTRATSRRHGPGSSRSGPPSPARPEGSSAPGSLARAAGYPEDRQLRHGRDVDGRLAHRRADPADPREPDRGFPHPPADHRHPFRRRRRRLDRHRRPGRLAPRRPAERRGGPRPGLLRQGRPADRDGRQPLSRPHRSGVLPGRPDADPSGAEPGRRRRPWPGASANPPARRPMGIVAIANANMEKAIRVISIERGFDPRDFALFSFGGAGGMHAVEMAGHLGMPAVIVPRNAGRPLGLRPAPGRFRQGLHESLMKPDSAVSVAGLDAEFRKLEARPAATWPGTDSPRGTSSSNARSTAAISASPTRSTCPSQGARTAARPSSRPSTPPRRSSIPTATTGRPVEIVNLRVKAVAVTPKIPLAKERGHVAARPAGRRPEAAHPLRTGGPTTARSSTGRGFGPGNDGPRPGPRHRSRIDDLPPARATPPGSTAIGNLIIRKAGTR